MVSCKKVSDTLNDNKDDIQPKNGAKNTERKLTTFRIDVENVFVVRHFYSGLGNSNSGWLNILIQVSSEIQTGV